MANLTPVAGYDPIPQLEKTDRVVGGAGGVSNTQAQALINNIEQVKSDYIPQVEKGAPNGVPYLDENGKVPSPMIPTTGALRGKWNANTNTPTITQGSNIVGGQTIGNSDYFMVDVAGTWNGIDFIVGDRIMWSDDDDAWFKLAGSSVTSVNGLQGAVVVPNTTVVVGNTTVTPNCDERLIVSGGTVTLGNALTQGITIQIVFIGNANTNIVYKNINGATVTDTILPNRQISYVWTGSAWFALSMHGIGESYIQMPDTSEPRLLFGGGWQRRYYGGLPLRDGNQRGVHAYLVRWNSPTQAVPVSGVFDYSIYQSAFYRDLYIGIHTYHIATITGMDAGWVNFDGNMWDNPNVNPGQTWLFFGLKETLPNVWGKWSSSESGAFHNKDARGEGCCWLTGEQWYKGADDSADKSPVFGMNLRRLGNKVWGRGAYSDPNNTTSLAGANQAVQTNSVDIYPWVRVY